MADDEQSPARMTIKIVGPCKSGKSTLAAALAALGYDAHSCAQEHSDVPTMWRRVRPADWLIYLDVNLETMQARTPRQDWSNQLLARQHRRLAHARQHCHLYLPTDNLTPQELLHQALDYLKQQNLRPQSPANPTAI